MGGFETKNVRAQVEVAEEKSPKVVLIYHGWSLKHIQHVNWHIGIWMIEYEFKRQTQAYAGHDWVYLKLESESMLNLMVCVHGEKEWAQRHDVSWTRGLR